MARLLNGFEPDASWGSSLVNTFMGWATPASPPPPRKCNGKFRPLPTNDDLCTSLAGLSVTNNHPYAPLELRSLFPVIPQTPILCPSMPPTSQSSDPAVASMRYRTISPPLQSSPAVGRTDFLSASSSLNDAGLSPRAAQRLNRHRLCPNRARRRPVYRPLDEAETADPLVQEPYDPLQELEPLTWLDGFRLQLRGEQSSKWKFKNWRHGNRDMRRERSRSHDMGGSTHAAKGATRRTMGRASRKVRAMPDRALQSYRRLQIRRAKNKLQWLRKNGFLSDQERMLTQDLRG
jgi:hypothetical protein